LNIKDFFTAFTATVGICRNKGLRVDLPIKIIGARSFKGNGSVKTVIKQIHRIAKAMLHLAVMIE
jgi:hypothetical protein